MGQILSHTADDTTNTYGVVKNESSESPESDLPEGGLTGLKFPEACITLDDEIHKMQPKYIALQKQIQDLTHQKSVLKSHIMKLKAEFYHLQETYSELKFNHNRLQKDFLKNKKVKSRSSSLYSRDSIILE